MHVDNNPIKIMDIQHEVRGVVNILSNVLSRDCDFIQRSSVNNERYVFNPL